MIRSRGLAFLAVAFVAVGLVPPAAAALPRGGVAVPGRSLGGLRLGATPAEVEAAWGSRFGRCQNCPDPTWYFTYRRFEPQGAGVSFRSGRVAAIFTLWSPIGWRTREGLAVGQPATRATAIYGPLPRVECDGYSALLLPGRSVFTALYVVGEKIWGFALSRAGVPACR